MKYGYDITDTQGRLWGDSGDELFKTREEAIKDAKSFIPQVIETESYNGYDIAGKLHVEIWETDCESLEVNNNDA